MSTRYTVVCDEERSRELRRLARKNGLTEEEVLQQLIDLGMDSLEEEKPA